MKFTFSGVVSVIAIVIAITAAMRPSTIDPVNVGGTGTRFPYGISADSTSPSAGEVRGSTLTVTGAAAITGNATVSGRTLTVTTSNTSTSTLVVGCVQMYATSTATAMKLQPTTTPGIALWQYGTCP